MECITHTQTSIGGLGTRLRDMAEGDFSETVQVPMLPDNTVSHAPPKKISLADLIVQTRHHPQTTRHSLTPRSNITTITDSSPLTPSPRRRDSVSSVTSSVGGNEEFVGGKWLRKRAVFQCDGHGKRESTWKLESTRRQQLTTIIHKSPENSTKSSRVHGSDLLNDSRSANSSDIVSMQTSKHGSTVNAGKRSRRHVHGVHALPNENSQNAGHSQQNMETGKSSDMTNETIGNSRGCQTSPAPSQREVDAVISAKLKPGAEEEFDYPISQMLLEYPYHPGHNVDDLIREASSRKNKSDTTEVLTEMEQNTKIIDINIENPAGHSDDRAEQVYNANGTMVIVTTYHQSDPEDGAPRPEESNSYRNMPGQETKSDESERQKHPTLPLETTVVSKADSPKICESENANDRSASVSDHIVNSSTDKHDVEKVESTVSNVQNVQECESKDSEETIDSAMMPKTSSVQPNENNTSITMENQTDMKDDIIIHSNSDVTNTSTSFDELNNKPTDQKLSTGHAITTEDGDGARSTNNDNRGLCSSPGHIKRVSLGDDPDPNKNTVAMVLTGEGNTVGADGPGPITCAPSETCDGTLGVGSPTQADSTPLEAGNEDSSTGRQISSSRDLPKASSRKANHQDDIEDEQRCAIPANHNHQQLEKEPETVRYNDSGKEDTVSSTSGVYRKRSKESTARTSGGQDLLKSYRQELAAEDKIGQAVLNVIQMWKESAVVRDLKHSSNGASDTERSSSSNNAELTAMTRSPSLGGLYDQSSCEESEHSGWPRGGGDRFGGSVGSSGDADGSGDGVSKQFHDGKGSLSSASMNSLVMGGSTTSKVVQAQPKQIQIVIRNPYQHANSKKESTIKIVIRLPQDISGANSPEVTENNVSNTGGEPENHCRIEYSEVDTGQHQVPESHGQQDEPQNEAHYEIHDETYRIQDELRCKIQDESPYKLKVTQTKDSNIESRIVLPPIQEHVIPDGKRQYTRLRHESGGKSKASSRATIRHTTVTSATLRMQEIDGVYCSNKGVFIGHDRKLYSNFRDASETTRVDKILENIKRMRGGVVNKPRTSVLSESPVVADEHSDGQIWDSCHFLYGDDVDDEFREHLENFRRGGSQKFNHKAVFAAAKQLYGQSRTRKARAYSNLHKKLKSLM